MQQVCTAVAARNDMVDNACRFAAARNGAPVVINE
jgi:hypothetical protein